MDLRIRCLRFDAALSRFGLFRTSFQANVALLTPRGAPRIFHLPIIHTILCTIAHQKNTMVELVATFLGQYALTVQLESHLVSLDCYTNWLLRYSFHQRLLVICRNIEITHDRAFGYTDSAAGLSTVPLLAVYG